jgi:uncharacterized membrane protein YczE
MNMEECNICACDRFVFLHSLLLSNSKLHGRFKKIDVFLNIYNPCICYLKGYMCFKYICIGLNIKLIGFETFVYIGRHLNFLALIYE